MISQSYVKDEDNSKNENLFIQSLNSFSKRLTLLGYYSGERVQVDKVYAIVCILLTYLNILGGICYRISFVGMLKDIFSFIISIINLTSFMIDNNIHTIFLFFLLILNIIYLIFFVILCIRITVVHNTHLIILLLKFYQNFNILNYWILYSIELELSLLVIFSPNLTGISSLHKYIAIFNILISVFISLIYAYFGNKIEFNFESRDYLSRMDSRAEIIIFLVKTFFSINFFMNYYFSFSTNLYLSICLILSIILLWFMTINSFYYYKLINVLFLFLNLSLIWSILAMYVISNFPSLGDLYLVMIIGYIALYPISKHAFKNYWRWLLSKIPFVELREGHIVCKYVGILISLICQENLSESDKLMLLGIVKQHELNCVYEKCICQADDGLTLVIPKNEVIYTKSNDNFGVEKSKVYFIHLVKNIFEFLLIVTRNSNINLTIMFAYFIYFYIGNYYYSLSVLINLTKMNNINLQQYNSLNRILKMIANKIEEINSNPVTKIDLEGKISYFKLDFNRIINFYEKITTLRTSISFALDYSLNFWNCILNKVEIDVIKKNGLEFYKHHSKIEETFKEINLIYDQLREINELYYNYKGHVFGEIRKINIRQSINFDLKEKDKFFNNRSTIIIANLTDRNKAIIEKISENIKNFLGYNSSECLGQDVKLLMPNFFKMKHSGFINNHFESGVSRITNKERQILGLHAKGYSIPINLSIKLLPNFSSNIFYVGFMREFNVDYDFIITSPKGKIEMISKGVFTNLINPHLFNFLDYYIHFLCKEYLDEINQIFDMNYTISDFSNPNQTTQKYNYSLLHFQKEANIERILIDFKKNDNTNQQGLDTSLNAMSVPISKIYNLKEKIKRNFLRDSIKKFSILDSFNILSNEELKIFKLYTHINTDLIANIEEMQLIEGYLQGFGKLERSDENDDETDFNNETNFNSKYINPSNQSSETNIRKESFKYTALVKEKYKPNEKPEKKQKAINYESGSNTSSLSSHVSQDYYKQYQSIMKRYSSKNTYEEIHYIIILNVLFLFVILLLIISNHITNYKGIINIFNSINDEYFPLINIYSDLTDINKNLISILNIKKDLINLSLFPSNYTENAFNDIRVFYKEFDDSRDFILNSTFAFSDNFVDKLFNKLTVIEPNYLNQDISLNQILIILSSYIGYLTNNTLIYPENKNVNFLLQNLNLELYNQIIRLFNESINDTKVLVSRLINAKQIYYLVIIFLVAGLGGFIYSHILCYYCKQNRMISLLLSIEQESSREIIDSIRMLKSTIYQKDVDPLEDEKFEEEQNLNKEEVKKNEKAENKKENMKASIQNNEKKESMKEKRNIKKKNRPSNLISVISPNVYISLFSKILFILCITLIPFITGTSLSFYDDKSLQILDLIINSNQNQYYFIISFLNYQELIYSNDNITSKLSILRNNINTFRNNQFLTSNLLYQTLNGLPGTNQFKSYFDSQFCNYIGTSINSTNDCADQKGAYTNFGFQYVMNININLIDQSITNNDFSSFKNDSVIKRFYSENSYILSEKTFDIMMRNGFKVYIDNLHSTLDSFMDAYENQFLIIFIFCIICLIFNQLISVLFMRHIIRVVNFELKNIFSLMPYLIFLTNPNINNLLSK